MTERVVRGQETNLLQKIVDVEIHFQDRFLAALVVQSDNERARRGGCDVEVNVWPSGLDVIQYYVHCSDKCHKPDIWDIALNNDAFLLKLSMRKPVRPEHSRLLGFLLLPTNGNNTHTR